MTNSRIHVDRSVPALIVKIGRYPLIHSGVGAIRSLGRLGVPMYAITETRWTPAAVSRYLRDCVVWPTTGREEPAWLLEGLLEIGRRIGRPTVLIPTDDEAAVLIAEHAADLRDAFLFPRIEPSLPRQLASKRGLHDLCLKYDVSTPRAAFPANLDELEKFAAEARFPIVAKNLEAFERCRASAVAGTTRVDDPTELRALARTWGEAFSVILQDYLPHGDTQDWIVNAYCDASSMCLVQFTGVRVRSWPPHSGMTTCAYAVANPMLAEMTAGFIKTIGFHGIVDVDWRYDRRDDEYKLLDFNPRVGAQFRLFETEAGMDVVRALHLDLTGREVRPGVQVSGRRLVVENGDLRALVAYRRSGGCTTPSVPTKASSTELAWLARDDPGPFLVVLASFIGSAARRLRQFSSAQWNLIRRGISLCRGHMYDRKRGIETTSKLDRSNLDVSADKRNQSWSYEPIDINRFKRIVSKLPVDFSTCSFVDVGSGKGRVIFLIAEMQCPHIIGIEQSTILHRIAELNRRKYITKTRSKAKIELHNIDALDFEYPLGPTIIFMFNPFKHDVMAGFLSNLKKSLDAAPRPVWLVYVNPTERQVVENTKIFTRFYQDLKTDGISMKHLKSDNFVIYRGGNG